MTFSLLALIVCHITALAIPTYPLCRVFTLTPTYSDGITRLNKTELLLDGRKERDV
jgi:hypothetical protein